jgi:hypothetical protein
VELVWTDGAGATVFVPEEMMDPNGTLHSYDNLTVRFETSWSGSAIYNISTSDRAITVQLPPEEDNGGGTDQPEYDEGLPNVDPYVGMYRGISADTVEVLCQLEVDELYEHGYHQESVLALYLDGVLQSEIDMLENTTEDTWYTDKMTEMVVSPGSHEINWTLWATKVNETEAVTIANGSGSFFRISDENMIGDAIDCLNEKLAGLMVDPDLRLTIDGLEPFKSYWTDDYGVGIRMILGEGAHVELSDLSSTLYDFVYVSARGPGTVVVNGADCWEFDLYPRDTHIQVKNVYTGYTYISGRNSMVRFDDCTLGGGIDFPWDGSCDISFYDCELDMGSWSQYYGIEDGSLVMDGCTVVSEENWSFKVRYEMNSTVTVRDCDFMNASLVLVPWGREGDGAYGGEADVTGCTFSGGGAYLSYIDERDSWSRNRTWEVETRIVGNRFIGEDCGLIIDGHRFVEALGPNTFDEGATLFASYFSEFSLTDTVDYYSNYSCFLMLDGVPVQATYRDEPPGQWSGSHWKEGMSIVPVTYIMGEEPNPGRVWAVLRDGYKGEGEVLYFYEFDPAYKDVHYVPYPDWRDISGLVLDLKVAMGTWGDGW